MNRGGYKIIFLILCLSAGSLNFALAYSGPTSDSISFTNISRNILKDLIPKQILNSNVSSTPKSDTQDSKDIKYIDTDNIEASNILDMAIEFIKLAVNLLFLTMYVLIEVLRGILSIIYSYKS